MRKGGNSGASREEAEVREYFSGGIRALGAVMETLGPGIRAAAEGVAASMRRGGKWMLFGNGGSAADAQHLAAEMVGRLYKLERRALPALALTTDSSALTCVGNDYSFDRVFARQVEALAAKGDAVFGISTSGNSANVIEGLKAARRLGCFTVGLSGGRGGRMKGLADLDLVVPSDETYHIQECHIAIGHLVCFLVEGRLKRAGFLGKRGR